MRSICLLSLIFLISVVPLAARSKKSTALDSGRIYLTAVSYLQLDSLIRTNDLTAVHFWPNWCSSSRMHYPEVLQVMSKKPGINYISVNDPDSYNWVSRRLTNPSDVVKGFYKMERHGREPFISINDRRQHRYFKKYFTGSSERLKYELIEYFLLFDRTGKLLYYNTAQFHVDSLATALAAY